MEDNISDTVNIVLLKDDIKSAIIANSLISQTDAFAWVVPSTIQPDLSYKKITSIINRIYQVQVTNLFQ